MSDPVEALPPLRDVIQRFDLAPKKSLGQNFLLDLNLTGRIARQVPKISKQHVIEVGPGPGGLTRAALLAGATQITVIEKDARCLDALSEIKAAAGERLTVVEGDALAVTLDDLSADGTPYILSNLPYNVATPLTLGWLAAIRNDPASIAGMTLMYQLEVVERLTAGPGSKTFGRLSVLAQWLCEVEHQFDVPARAFTPPPKVTSAIARFTPRSEPLFPAEIATVERLTAAAFGQRRKMLRASLKSLGQDSLALLANANVEPTARAEAIDLAAFGRLAAVLEQKSCVGAEKLDRKRL